MTPVISGANWRKSSYSGGQGGECVELAAVADGVALRDSRDPDGPELLMDRADFRRLAEVLKKG